MDLPLHVLPEPNARATLAWSVRRDPAGNLLAEARNSGTGPGAVSALEVQDGSGRSLATSRARGTVLPASTRVWRIGQADGTPAILLVTTPDGVQRSSIGALQP
jgi:fimbrial chaperone protein